MIDMQSFLFGLIVGVMGQTTLLCIVLEIKNHLQERHPK